MFKFYYIVTYPITLLFLFCIFLYRKVLRFGHGKSCHYTPTCSHYAWDSIVEFGWLFGGFLALKRILRCTPNHKAGVDYPKLNLLGNYKWKC
ncbi:MAG: membrane protein insertion efficiency factor YidD [Clostridia bacterium]|nr:membrane protein insertion efficiency factor YidD [Clostridia bacterium]